MSYNSHFLIITVLPRVSSLRVLFVESMDARSCRTTRRDSFYAIMHPPHPLFVRGPLPNELPLLERQLIWLISHEKSHTVTHTPPWSPQPFGQPHATHAPCVAFDFQTKSTWKWSHSNCSAVAPEIPNAPEGESSQSSACPPYPRTIPSTADTCLASRLRESRPRVVFFLLLLPPSLGVPAEGPGDSLLPVLLRPRAGPLMPPRQRGPCGGAPR